MEGKWVGVTWLDTYLVYFSPKKLQQLGSCKDVALAKESHGW